MRYILLLDNYTLAFSADRSTSGGAAIQYCGSSWNCLFPQSAEVTVLVALLWTESDILRNDLSNNGDGDETKKKKDCKGS